MQLLYLLRRRLWKVVILSPAYGLIPEFVDLFPFLVSLSALSGDQLVEVKLHFREGALRLIARKAITKNTRARGLRSILDLESILMDAMYEVFIYRRPEYYRGVVGFDDEFQEFVKGELRKLMAEAKEIAEVEVVAERKSITRR